MNAECAIRGTMDPTAPIQTKWNMYKYTRRWLFILSRFPISQLARSDVYNTQAISEASVLEIGKKAFGGPQAAQRDRRREGDKSAILRTGNTLLADL
jgi:hypothetical protein